MLLVVCAAGVVGDATESTYRSLFVLFLEIASDIRGIYTLFLKKRREWQGDAEVLAYMDLLLVITGSYFHQNRSLVCDKLSHFNKQTNPITNSPESTSTLPPASTRGDSFVSTSTVFVSTYSSVSSTRTPKCRSSSGTSSSSSNYVPRSPLAHVESRLDAEGDSRRERRPVAHRGRVVVVETDVVAALR